MINWTDTFLRWTEPKPVLSAAVPLLTEGMGLVAAFENGVEKVAPATGQNSDVFVGIAMGPRRSFSTNFHMDSIAVPAVGPFTVLLPHAVLNGAVGVYAASGGQLAAGNGAAAGGANANVNVGTDPVSGNTILTFDSSFAGQTFIYSYNYTMSAQDQTGTFGDPKPGNPIEQQLVQVEVFMEGPISTNLVDPQANFYAGNGPRVKLVAGGVFTDVGSTKPGIILPNANISVLPTPMNAYLKLDLT